MALKAIVMDIDGTLVSSQKKITTKTKEALINAQKNGIKVILASGRPTRGMYGYAKELELEKYEGFLVSYNGAVVTDCKTNEILFNQTLSVKDGQDILNHLKKFDVIPMLYKDEYMYVSNVYKNMIDLPDGPYNIVEYEARGCDFLICEKANLAAFANFPMNKILVAGNPLYLKEKVEEMYAPFTEKVSCVFSAPFYLEFTDKGIDKAKALSTVLPPLGIESVDVISFGDGQNDLSIIEYAGMGVAMGNAVEELKNIANHITLSNDEDGIAVALEKFLYK